MSSATGNADTIAARRTTAICALGLALLPISLASAGQWPRFRGPNGQGVSDASGLPVEWTEQNYAWKRELAGIGHSSPVVWDNTVFVTGADQEAPAGIVQALSLSDGDQLWQRRYPLSSYRMNRDNSYAVSTPALDAQHVYLLWPTASETLLIALTHEGDPVWKRTFPGTESQHGPGTSPIVYEDAVVFTLENEKRSQSPPSMWIAVDCETGADRWRVPRDTSDKTSYSTPCVYAADGSRPHLVFTSFAHGVTAVNPDTGKVAWEFEPAFTARVVSSPVIVDNLVAGTCGNGGSGKYVIAVDPHQDRSSTAPSEAWRIANRTAPYVPTPLAHDGLLFLFHDRGDITCVRSDTGKQLWSEKPAGRFYGSPVLADGRLYCITRDGDVVVLKAGPKYELLAVNALGEDSSATPAIAHGRMLLRTNSHLMCIESADAASQIDFQLVDYHVHLKGGLTLEQAIAHANARGLKYGIAQNCGLGFPVTNDAGLQRFLDSLEGKPVYAAMQAEGREWVNMFSPEMIAKADYVFTDAMTFTDDKGRRMRLWMPNEVHVDDEQDFMDMLVRRIEGVMAEPIDIYVNPTFLPARIADKYEQLWTDRRMDRVIAAAVQHGVAIEINARYKLPSKEFILKAKEEGVEFACGTNNTGPNDLGNLEYCRRMIRECGLTKDDFFVPRPRDQKRIHRRR